MMQAAGVPRNKEEAQTAGDLALATFYNPACGAAEERLPKIPPGEAEAIRVAFRKRN